MGCLKLGVDFFSASEAENEQKRLEVAGRGGKSGQSADGGFQPARSVM